MGEFNFDTVDSYVDHMREYYGDAFVERNKQQIERIYALSRRIVYTPDEYELFREPGQ